MIFKYANQTFINVGMFHSLVTSAKYSVGADMLSSASVYSETDKLWLKSSFDVDEAIGITELDDNLILTVLLPFASSIIMT